MELYAISISGLLVIQSRYSVSVHVIKFPATIRTLVIIYLPKFNIQIFGTPRHEGEWGTWTRNSTHFRQRH